jgi:diaminopimelate decarboxylase
LIVTRPLTIENLPATELAERFGTPLYIISETAIRERYRRTQAAARVVYPRANVYYAVKANPILAVRRILAEEGAGGDVFSAGELALSRRAGVPGSKLVMNGQAKDEPELELAVREGITVTLDNLGELELLVSVARRLGAKASVFVRLKLALDRVASGAEEEGPKIAERVARTVWGFTEEEAIPAVKRALEAPELELRGYHHHIGYFVPRPAYHGDLMRDVVAGIARLRDATGYAPGTLDLGGGWAYPADPESGNPDAHQVPPPEEFARVQLGSLKASLDDQGLPHPEVIFELGRSLVGESATLLGRVRWVKEQHGRRYVITDATKHLLLRACIEGYGYRWVKANDLDAPAAGPADLFGPTCTDDELAIQYPFAAVARGDLVAALACGAYAQTFGATLNSLPRPAVVMVRGDQAEVVVRRDTLDDILGRYELPTWFAEEARAKL